MENLADIGVVGLAAMGSNLARNLAHQGYRVAVFNRSAWRTDDLMKKHGSEGSFVPATSIAEFVASLKKPRTAIVMVKAGDPTQSMIDQLADAMEPGDIIIDGGNTYFEDTMRREQELRARGLHFVGCGISGGEEGALRGPSMMPGGSDESWATIGPILERISAKAPDGSPCVTHIGENGSGHFVKMVHNGIEYADMQL
ncbi:MAG: NADP-dependent phosphogluconate dehydrogenase, partial [Aeriscardovia sp.]|nr:NADP-dependent phosphogluconate dehydrogenase [Aeriscardovia sp.]